MSLLLLGLAALTSDGSIVITAAREPVPLALSGAAVTIIDAETLKAINLPLAVDALRLAPSVAVASSGPLGSQTQVRLRGAEANHTVTFIDGIKVNDSASSAEFRWENLLAGGIDRIEVLRGPQSALWGSEAIGGVVNVVTRMPGAGTAAFGQIEAGSFGTWNLGGGANFGTDTAGVVAQGQYLHQTGIDTAHSGGDKDGYHNLTLSAKGQWQAAPNVEFGLVARYTDATTKFDDFDYGLGVSADAPFASRSKALMLRGTGSLALMDDAWRQRIEVVRTDTSNINSNADVFQNQSDGSRTKFGYQTSLNFDTGAAQHRLIAAVDYERQSFHSIDADPTALSNQRRSRDQTSLIADYRLTLNKLFAVGASLRHDINTSYANTTTVRANAALALPQGLRAHASYGSGVADPTFFDLYGFFPSYFVGNPNLSPEKSTGWDIGIGWEGGGFTSDLTWFKTRLQDEIVSTYDFATGVAGVANASGTSHRQGLEASLGARASDWLRLRASYAWLDASETKLAGGLASRELRRPEHSGSLTAIATLGAARLSASAAYVGVRYDTDFSTFSRARLPAYTLLTLSGSYQLTKALELTARIENAADARYQDVIGYRTMGIGAFGGVRVKWGS